MSKNIYNVQIVHLFKKIQSMIVSFFILDVHV